MSSRLIVPALAFIGLLGGLFTAQAGKSPPKPTTTPACTEPAPDKDRCLSVSPSKIKGGPSVAYLETPCGRRYASTCAPFLHTAVQQSTPGCTGCQGDACKSCGTPTSDKALASKGTNMPADLRPAYRLKSYGAPSKGSRLETRGHHVLARAQLSGPPADKAADPAHAHRQPEWDKNGQKIGSCEEFAYEDLYDAMRFIDAAAACAGDRKCEMDIAYLPSTPGIANRVLKSKDGKPLKFRRLKDKWEDSGRTIERFEVLTSGVIPKNDMFAAPAGVVYAGDFDASTGNEAPSTADLDALAGAVDNGKGYYAFGKSLPTLGPPGETTKIKRIGGKKFKDEWDFHTRMRASHALGDAEFAEFDRRKREFGRLLNALNAAQVEGCNAMIEKGGSCKIGSILMQPGSEPFDPMDRDQRMVRADAPATGVLAVPTKPGATATRQVNPSKLLPCDPRKWGTLEAGYLADVGYRGPASCRLGQFLRDEWARKAAGQASCLDLGSDACDWSPGLFHRRFVAGFKLANAQAYLEHTCKAYTGGSFTPAAKDLKDARKFIADMKRIIGHALRDLKPYSKKYDAKKLEGEKLSVLGQTWSDGEEMGDKDWFAAGYDYSVGWKIGPEQVKVTTNKDDSKTKRVCRLSAHADGNVKAHATLAKQHISILYADLHADLNQGDKGKTGLDSQLKVLGIDVAGFLKAAESLSKAFTPHHGSGISEKGPEASFTVMLGPVPVTGAIWGELNYGADFGLHHKLSGGCDPEKLGFQLHGEFNPHIGVDGKAQVGVGISGILSAGIRTSVELLTVGVPLDVDLSVGTKRVDKHDVEMVQFDAGVDLRLSTLSGYVAIYLEELMFSQEFEVFDWNGASSRFPLMPKLEADLPLFTWPDPQLFVETNGG